MNPPQNTRRNSLSQETFLINNVAQVPIIFNKTKIKFPKKKALLRRVSFNEVKSAALRRHSPCYVRRHSTAVNQIHSVNQRDTVFTRNSGTPELCKIFLFFFNKKG